MAVITTSAMTLADARNAVRGIINESLTGQFDVTFVDNHLNTCARRIYAVMNIGANFRAHRNTEAGVNQYEVADADLFDGRVHVEKVYINDTEISAVEFAPLTDDAIMETGEPTSFMLDGSDIILMPTPDTADYELQVIYRRDYAAPQSETDVFPLNDLQLDTCVLYAAYMLKLADEEYQAAGMLKTQYEDTYLLATRIPTGLYKNVQVPTY